MKEYRFKDIKISQQFYWQQCEVLGMLRYKKISKYLAKGLEEGTWNLVKFRLNTLVDI